MLPNSWNQPRFRQEEPNPHHFYSQELHPTSTGLPMNVVLTTDAHHGMGTSIGGSHQGLGNAHQHSGLNTHSNINNAHFHHMMRGHDNQYKPEHLVQEPKMQGIPRDIKPQDLQVRGASPVPKKKSKNNGVLVKLPRGLRREAKVWSRLYAQRDETGKLKQGFLMPQTLQQVLRTAIKKKDEEIATLKSKLSAYESTNARSSRYRGVSRNGQTGWCSVARCPEKGRVYCGTYQTEVEAAKAWDRKTIELTGNAAERRLNFPEDPEIQTLLANARSTKKSGTYSKYRGVEIIQHKYNSKTKKNSDDLDSLEEGNKTYLIRVHSKTVASCKTELEAAYGYNEVAFVLGLHATNDVAWEDYLDQSQERERVAIQELRMIKKEDTLKLKSSENRRAKEKKKKEPAMRMAGRMAKKQFDSDLSMNGKRQSPLQPGPLETTRKKKMKT